MKDLLEAGSSLRPPNQRWNPKMKEYIFGERNGIYIIDLGKTVKLFREAEEFPHAPGPPKAGRSCSWAPSGRPRTSSRKKRQRCGMFYVNERWLGGLLTNFATIQRSLGRVAGPRGDGNRWTVRHALEEGNRACERRKERKKLAKNLDGIRGMSRLPDAVSRGRYEERKDCRRRGAQAQDSRHRHRGYQLRLRMKWIS